MPEGLLIAVLAAGGSRRLGRPKQLVNIDGEPLLRRQCRVALEAEVGAVTAILGCHADRCAAALAGLPVALRLNDPWAEGLASSIRAATRAAMERDAAGLLVLHGDQYRLTPHDLQTLHAAWAAAGGSKACRARHADYSGPPVILPAACFEKLLMLRGEEGARRVIQQLEANSLIEVEMPTAVHDLDWPAQLGSLVKETHRGGSAG